MGKRLIKIYFISHYPLISLVINSVNICRLSLFCPWRYSGSDLSVVISTHEPLVLFSLLCPERQWQSSSGGGCLSTHCIVLRAELCTSSAVQPNFTASLRAQGFLVLGACSEDVQGDLECTVMGIAHLKPVIHVTCQNPDPDLSAVRFSHRCRFITNLKRV